MQRTTWTYDANGNRLRELRRALASDPTPQETDVYTTTAGSNRLAAVATPAGTRTVAYDARGNTASEARPDSVAVTTAYDGYARLTGYTRGSEVLSFTYNGRDDRVAMNSSSAGIRRFVYDPDGRVIGEYGNLHSYRSVAIRIKRSQKGCHLT